jgi:hypothetical protein
MWKKSLRLFTPKPARSHSETIFIEQMTVMQGMEDQFLNHGAVSTTEMDLYLAAY